MIFKLISCIKEHWWSLSLSWSDEVQRMFSTAHCLFMIIVLQPQTFSFMSF